MHTKTMEGLVGARTNMELVNTPMRVYKDARRRGDTAVMERAMGYAADFSDRTAAYRAEADEGMEEDAKEAREKEKTMREEALRKRREEREKQEERIEESRNECADTLELSGEGRALAQELKKSDARSPEPSDTGGEAEPAPGAKAAQTDATLQPEGGFSVSV